MYETILEKLALRAPRKRVEDDARFDGEVSKLLSRIKKNISRSKNIYSTRGGLNSMGARGPVLKDPGIHSRRVIVKVSYVKPKSAHARTIIRHHLHYAAQNKNVELNNSPELYSHDDEPVDFKEKISELQKSPHMFNVIISPEDGHDLDLKEFTRNFVSQIEKDLGTKLDWAAGNHYDTNDPHVHLLFKGQDDKGKKLILKPDYISRGLRSRACQVATNKLGLRPWEEVVKSLQLEINKPKKTALDTLINRQTKNNCFDLNHASSDDLDDLPKNLFKQRLEFLQSKKLAHKTGEHTWSIDQNLFIKLNELGRTSSILDRLSGSIRVDKQNCEIISAKCLENRAVTGHVVERNYVDDQSDREYLLVKSKEKKYVYVELEKYSEKSPAQPGEFVRIESTKPFAGPRASDKNIFEHSIKHGGIYDANSHADAVQDSKRLPPGVSAASYVQVHVNRLEVLARKDLVKKLDDGRFEIPGKYLENLEAESRKSLQKFNAHIKVVRLSPARLKSRANRLGQSL